MPATSQRSQGKSRTASSARSSRKRLRISIVGAGRLGTALGRALRRAGHEIELVVAVHAASARRAAKGLGKGTLAATPVQLQDAKSKAHRSLTESELVIIATPDGAIQTVATELAQALANRRTKLEKVARTVLHTSGAMPAQVLDPLRRCGFAVGSMHPLVSVADKNSDAEIFRDVHFCLEGEVKAVRLARMLVTQLGGRSFTINSEAKPLYHAAAVMASGHVTALFDLALMMLRECGVSNAEAQRILLPLLSSAAQNLRKKTPARGLTGPYARGDLETVRRHLHSLNIVGLEAASEVYKILARHSLDLGKTLKRDENFRQIAALLDSESER
jgi:predicted short-subunit dehydrogenase-like oxidoreductase (DUF2520 family)